MPGGIWDAIGQALLSGSQTLGRVNAQELEQKRYLDDKRFREQSHADQLAQQDTQNQMERERLDAAEKDRKFRILQAAIEGVAPGGAVSNDVFNSAKEFGLQDQFAKQPMDLLPAQNLDGSITSSAAGTITRKPTFAESRQMEQDRQVAGELARKNEFRNRLSSPEFGAEPFDQQVREAAVNGINLPLSGAEFDRRQGVEHQNRIGEIAEQNKRPYLSQVNKGATPTTDALVQAMLANPAAFEKLPSALKTKLAPALAEAGFNFRQPPAGVSSYSKERQARVLGDIDAIEDHIGGLTTGMGGWALSALPATEARALAGKLNTLKSNIMMNELTEMRAASKTGGALGQVSDKEGELLANALGALDQFQNGKDLYEQLEKIRTAIGNWEAAKAAEQAAYSPVDDPAAANFNVAKPAGTTGGAATKKTIGRFEIIEH